MDTQEIKQVTQAWRTAVTRLVIVNPSCMVETERSAENKSSGVARNFFDHLKADSRNEVVLLGAGTREELDCFTDIAATLVAENGGFSKRRGGEWEPFISGSVLWREPVRKALHTLVNRYEGSFLEEKYFSLAWHFDENGVIISGEDKRQLFSGLRALARQFDLALKESDGAVEFTIPSIGREQFVTDWMTRHGHYDLIMAVGDNMDEGLFQLLEGFVTICVHSKGPSGARYEIRNSSDVFLLLSRIVLADMPGSVKM